MHGLPVDVLLRFTPWLGRADLSQLMTTSKGLYDVFLPELIKGAGTILLSRILAFHRFLRVHEHSGAPRVRWLNGFEYYSSHVHPFVSTISASEGARVVLEILGRASNLNSLTLDNVGDFDADQLRAVLSTLLRLTYVDLRRVKMESHQDILLDATAPLATVRLSLAMSVPNYAIATDPSPMLRAHMSSTTIETLYLQNVQLTPQSGPFPAVRRLQITEYYLSYGRGAEMLQTLFPAAREIWLFNRYLDPEFRYRLERGYGVASEMEELRKRNREWQLAHRSQLWPSLKYLRVDGEHAAYVDWTM